MFYVIGIADREFERVGSNPARVFNPDQGWTWALIRYRCLRLPFVSYQRNRFRFYLGWRNRGNFGIELKWSEVNPKKKRSAGRSSTRSYISAFEESGWPEVVE